MARRARTTAFCVFTAAVCCAVPGDARACSGPFYEGPDTIPLRDSVGVPVNTLIQIEDELGTGGTLDVELSPSGASGVALTLTRDATRPLFVGSPVEPLAANTLYEVRVDRATYCSWPYGGVMSTECSAAALDDGPVTLTSFRTSDVTDAQSPVAGEGRASFSFSALVDESGSSCAHLQGTYVVVTADEAGWVASDDGGIAGYRQVYEGEVGSELRATPFPRGTLRCSDLGSGNLLPGTYQVLAEDYLGNQSMLSAESVLVDGCPRGGAQCSASPASRGGSGGGAMAAFAALGLALLRRRLARWPPLI